MTNCVKTLCKNKKTNRSVIKIPLSPEDKKIFENVWKDLDVDTLGAHHMYDSIFGESWYLGNPQVDKSFNFISHVKVSLIPASLTLQITLQKVTSSLRYEIFDFLHLRDQSWCHTGAGPLTN